MSGHVVNIKKVNLKSLSVNGIFFVNSALKAMKKVFKVY